MYENYTGTPTKRDPGSDQEPDAPAADVLNEHFDEPGDPDGVVAADEQRHWQETHPSPEPLPPARRKRKHRLLKAFVVLVVITAAATGAFKFGDYKASAPAAKPITPAPAVPKQAAKPVVVIKHYDSVTYTLGLDYPKDWTVSDTTAKLTVTSPSMELTTSSGAKVSGHVVATIQNKQPTIAAFPVDGAVAVLASDKLTYKQPSAVQRAQTYVSYLSYSAANGLNAVFVTGDNGYLQAQNIPLSDVIAGDPLISVSFETCATADCATGTPVPITLLASSWKTASFSSQVTALLESIQLN